MKYRITKKGEKLWPNFSYVWDKSHLKEKGVSITGAIKMGLFEEVPDRITLCRGQCGTNGHKAFIFKSMADNRPDPQWDASEVEKLEHCINNEWHLIPECFEEMIRTLDDFQASSFVNLRDFIDIKIAVLKNTD